MTPAQRDAISKFVLEKAPLQSLFNALGTDPQTNDAFVAEALQRAIDSNNPQDVEAVVSLTWIFGPHEQWAPLLAKLLELDWHCSHEEIANALQDLRDPTTVDALFRVAQKRHAYLAYNDNYALTVKCVWALHDVGTDAAIERLKQLAMTETVEDVGEIVADRLAALAARRTPARRCA